MTKELDKKIEEIKKMSLHLKESGLIQKCINLAEGYGTRSGTVFNPKSKFFNFEYENIRISYSIKPKGKKMNPALTIMDGLINILVLESVTGTNNQKYFPVIDGLYLSEYNPTKDWESKITKILKEDKEKIVLYDLNKRFGKNKE